MSSRAGHTVLVCVSAVGRATQCFGRAKRTSSTILNVGRPRNIPSLRDGAMQDRHADETAVTREVDEELKLPKKASLVIILFANVLLQVCFWPQVALPTRTLTPHY